MADKTIGQLTPASQVTPTDLFVLEQSGTAKKLTGQILENWLVSFADGHGGIQTIEKTGTSGLTDTYTITLADTTTMTFTVTNGKGIQSIATYWAVSSNGTTPPTNWSLTRQSMTSTNRYLWSHQTITYNDGSIVNTTSSVVGVYGDKGDTGNTGVGISTLAQTARTPGVSTTYTFTMTDGSTKSFVSYDGVGIADIAYTSSSGLVDTYTVTMTNGDTDTFTVTNAKSISSVTMVSGTHAPGTTDTYRITFNDGDTTDFTVYNGTNGTGSVSAVDGIQAVNQNVPLLLTGNGAPTASTVGQLNQRYFDLNSHILYICTAIDTSGAESTYSWAGTGVPVDSALSTMSSNPVQNSVITNRFGTLETSIAAKLPLAGGTMNGNIVMANHKITNLGEPTANGDAVNKSYVDSNYRTETAQDAIDALFSAYKRTNNNLVCFGDSWTVGTGIAVADRPTKRFTAIVAKKLNCTEFNFGEGASGFIRSGNLFSTQINTANSQMTSEQKENTGVVLIVGGVNDYRQQLTTSTQAQFVNGVVSTANLAHSVFPNALIVLGIGNTNLSYFPEKARQWYSAAISACEQQLEYPSLIIKNLYNVISGNTSMYSSDNLHPNESGHGKFGGYIANAILGGGQTVFSAIGTVSLSSGVTLDGTEGPTELTLWRINDEVVIGAARFTFSPAVTSAKIIGTIPTKSAPPSNAYYPFYNSDQHAGNIAITASGNMYLIPATGVSSLPSGFNQQLRYMFGKPTNTDES